MKGLEFINNKAKKEFYALPSDVQNKFDTDLMAICRNEEPFSKFKHLTQSVGTGAIELIENGCPAYRSIYVAKYNNTVYVLYSFKKTTNHVDLKAMKTGDNS